MTTRLLEVGRIGRPHGVKGELYVDLLTDRVERLAVGSRLLAGDQWLTVGAARLVGSRWLVRFASCADRNDAERLVNLPLLAEPVASDSNDSDALYVHDLIGSEVVGSGGHLFGRCVAVVANPAHDLLELDDGSLVPIVFVTGVAGGRIEIDPPEGLFDLGE